MNCFVNMKGYGGAVITKRMGSLIAACLLLVSGCAGMPDLKRMQGNMDAMVWYMGSTADSTRRMADNADRMQGQVGQMVAALEKKGQSAERAVQNYLQAFVDNDRASIAQLKNISQELSMVRGALRKPAEVPAPDDAKRREELNGKLRALQERLDTITTRLEKMEKRSRE